MAVGLLLSFVIVKIIIARSIKILTKQNLLSLGIFAVLAALFTGIVMFDLAGYGRWAPDAEDVASVDSDSIYYNDSYNYYQFADDFYKENETLTSPDAIEKVVALHQYASEHSLEDKEYTALAQDPKNYLKKYVHLTFRYKMKDGSSRDRQYRVEMTEEMVSLLNEVLSCEEYRADACLSEQITAENVSYIYISAYDTREKFPDDETGEITPVPTGNAEAVVTLNREEEIADFLAALRKDDYNRTYTVDLSGALQNENASFKLSLYCSIGMKEGAAGTLIPETGSSNDGIAIDYVYTKGGNNATVDFSLSEQDQHALHLLRGKLAAEGYEEHAKLLEKY
ncbi:MAG: hypothetical protein ACI4LJ_04050, partial [Anaerovoracaceae bacterium]